MKPFIAALVTFLTATVCFGEFDENNNWIGLKEKVFSKIHEGDTEEHLVEVLGAPNNFKPSAKAPNTDVYSYEEGSIICSFAIRKRTVKSRECVENASYKPTPKPTQESDARKVAHAIGKVLGGVGKANSNSQEVDCVSQSNGNTVNTRCHN